jgi:hypothetical protein
MDKGTEPPIACTLQGGSYQERLDWIAELARDGLHSHNRTDLVLELRFAAEVVARVREMVRKEEACCAFLAFELGEADGEVRLTITAPEKARDVADGLFEQFVPSPVSSRSSVAVPPGETCCGDDSGCR